MSALILALLGVVGSFWLALFLLVLWGLIFAADMPIRQAYLNDMIPSQQRATVLSFDSLMGSSGASSSSRCSARRQMPTATRRRSSSAPSSSCLRSRSSCGAAEREPGRHRGRVDRRRADGSPKDDTAGRVAPRVINAESS